MGVDNDECICTNFIISPSSFLLSMSGGGIGDDLCFDLFRLLWCLKYESFGIGFMDEIDIPIKLPL